MDFFERVENDSSLTRDKKTETLLDPIYLLHLSYGGQKFTKKTKPSHYQACKYLHVLA